MKEIIKASAETDMTPEAPSNWPEEIAEWLRSEGEAVLVVDNCPLHRLPDVWDGVNERRPKEVNKPAEARAAQPTQNDSTR